MAPRPKEHTLAVRWSKREDDILYEHPAGPQTASDGHYLYGVFGRERRDAYLDEVMQPFVKELKERGYDLKTLRFSIMKDMRHPRWQELPPRS